jgi:hypothetical protein
MHMTTDLRDVSARLETLERENRRLKRFGLAALGALGVLSLASFAAAPLVCDVLYCERLVIRDARGGQRVKIDAYNTETPGFELYDRDGKSRAKLYLDNEGEAFLTVYDAKGKVKANHALGVMHETSPTTPTPVDKKPDAAMAND